MKKKIIAGILTLCMVVTMTPASQGDVAELNGKTFPTLEFAIEMASSGDTVKLLSDVNESVEIKK